MRRALPRLCLPTVLAVLVLAAPPARAADAAGRVLISTGQVVALRAGRPVPLVTGSAVDVGDQITTGVASNAQIRFSDASIVSLKPQTEFQVNDYFFNGNEDGSEKAFFSLLRGGLRTVTGLIGHVHKSSYGVQTPSATIGIRGTVWGATHCVADECKNKDGSTAKPGTYGEVKSGAIAVANNAPEVEFGANTAFYVADRNTPPTRLLVAPEFVSAQIQTRSLNATASSSGGGDSGPGGGAASSSGAAGATGGAGSSGAATSGAATSGAGTSGAGTSGAGTSGGAAVASGAAATLVQAASTSVAGITPLLNSSLPSVYVAANNTTPSGTPSVIAPTTSASTSSISGVTAFFSLYTVGVNGVDMIESCTGGGCGFADVTSYAFSGGQVLSWSSTTGPQALTRTAPVGSNAQLINLGAAGDIYIAQLVGPYSGTATTGAAFNGPGGFVYLATNSPLVNGSDPLPSSGSFTFGSPGQIIGLAVDSAGNVGKFSQFSEAFNAATRTVSFAGVINFASVAGYGSATFTLGSSAVIPTGSDNLSDGTLTATCLGGGCAGATSSGTWAARLLHSPTTIPAMAISGGLLNATRNGGSGNSMVFIGAGKCITGC